MLLELEADVPSSAEPVRQAALVRFAPDRVVDVSLQIESACVGVVCGPDQTCAGGVCRDVELPAACLADHGEPAPAGCDDPRALRGCAGE